MFKLESVIYLYAKLQVVLHFSTFIETFPTLGNHNYNSASIQECILEAFMYILRRRKEDKYTLRMRSTWHSQCIITADINNSLLSILEVRNCTNKRGNVFPSIPNLKLSGRQAVGET